MLFFAALIISAGLSPIIQSLANKLKIGRGVSAFVVYVNIFFIVGLVLISIAPILALQVRAIVYEAPRYLSSFNLPGHLLPTDALITILNKFIQAPDIATTDIKSSLLFLGNLVLNLFGGFFSAIMLFVIIFYMIIEEESINKCILLFTPDAYKTYVNQLITKIHNKVGLWLRGQVILCFIVGLLAYLSLIAIGVEYAAILSVLFGIGELVPYIGPTLAAVPAIFLAFTQSFDLGLMVIGVYVIIQIVENNIFVPLIMNKVVGLNPLIIILALLIGGKIGGIAGMLLAIPIATVANIIIIDLFITKNQNILGVDSHDV